MPTYSKETALFDTGKIGDDINDAAGQVNKYITQIGDTGIKVHPYDSTNEQVDTDNYTKIDANGMEVYQNIDGASTKVASFGSDGATIGQSGAAHLSISNDGLTVYNTNGISEIIDFGIGSVINSAGNVTTGPYYTFSSRKGAKGFGSFAEGGTTTASAAWSHAEGENTYATAWCAHAEGHGSKASAYAAHAEGIAEASGDMSHAEGSAVASAKEAHAEGSAVASGIGSHAQNFSTTAQGAYQTAIGQYNIAQGTANYAAATDHAFIIGNGTYSTPSNALTVDWSGNLEAAGDITDGGGNVLSNKLDASTLVDYVTEQASSGNWRYRKWHSGRVEAWFNDSITMSATTQQGNLYRRSATLAIPSGIFTIAPGVIVGSQTSDNTIVSVKGSASSETSITITDYRTNQNSSTQSRAIRVYAWQNPTS